MSCGLKLINYCKMSWIQQELFAGMGWKSMFLSIIYFQHYLYTVLGESLNQYQQDKHSNTPQLHSVLVHIRLLTLLSAGVLLTLTTVPHKTTTGRSQNSLEARGHEKLNKDFTSSGTFKIPDQASTLILFYSAITESIIT